jgi:hypothetical protein
MASRFGKIRRKSMRSTNLNFIENVVQGRPALALISTTQRLLAKGNGCGGDHNKEKIPAGHIRAVRLVAIQDASSLKAMRRELLAIVGGNQKHWRIAKGVA